MALVRKLNIPGFDSLQLPSPSVFPVYQVNGTCSSGMCNFEALIFLENVLILKVVVYLGEATAIRSGNGSGNNRSGNDRE